MGIRMSLDFLIRKLFATLYARCAVPWPPQFPQWHFEPKRLQPMECKATRSTDATSHIHFLVGSCILCDSPLANRNTKHKNYNTFILACEFLLTF